MDVTFDPHLFTQIGLDSASLTMLGTVVHGFREPGEYRCVVHEGPVVRAAFTIRSDPDSPRAQATVDLEDLVSGSTRGGCCCGEGSGGSGGGMHEIPGVPTGASYDVNPRGFVVFRVGRGKGQYYVHARRVDAKAEDKGYETRRLVEGDSFSAILLRPGTYDVVDRIGGGKAQVVVSYPKPGERNYRPPGPVRLVCSGKAIEPAQLTIGPAQGLIFEVRAASRIEIRLAKADDGPANPDPAPARRFVRRLAEGQRP